MGPLYISRFFREDDKRKDKVIFDLPEYWWSRPYEYAWASEFVNHSDIVLDAACGICHPLKFYLLDKCQEVHACDIDDKILSDDQILQEIKKEYGTNACVNFPKKYLRDIHYSKASLTELPYKDNMFDRIFCISVIEHLNDVSNKYSRWPKIFRCKLFNRLFPQDIYRSLKEFKRILKDDGLIVLTLDYPRINLEYLRKILPEIGLTFADKVSFIIPQNAIYSKKDKIYCFRALLKNINKKVQRAV